MANILGARTAALIPAAGKGERLGLGPKAFLPLGEHSLLKQVLLAFEGEVDELWVAVSPAMMTDIEQHIVADTKVILGGATRQETVANLAKVSQADSLLIHDAARPFLSKKLIRACLKGVAEHQAISVAKPVSDSLIHKESSEVIDRSQLLAVQTPQGFKKSLLLRAHENALSKKLAATDDAALVRQLGHTVKIIEGSAWLMKITTAADYEMARALAKNWHLNNEA